MFIAAVCYINKSPRSSGDFPPAFGLHRAPSQGLTPRKPVAISAAMVKQYSDFEEFD
jgi:hypothetical protein